MSTAYESAGTKGPLSEAVVVALCNLVDDAVKDRRDPSHSDLAHLIERAELADVDPVRHGQTVGKAKRLRAVLTSALDRAPAKGERLVGSVVATVRANGGFRVGSPNYVGKEAIVDLAAAFKEEGVLLAADGTVTPLALDNLSGRELTIALLTYVRRAKRGADDAALLVGTGKDLLEATAKHVIVERMTLPPKEMDFPTLMGQAFHILGLATPDEPRVPHEHPRRRVQRALFEAACAVNALRSREGTGHGRAWPSTVSAAEARMAVETMGVIAEYLLEALHPQGRAD